MHELSVARDILLILKEKYPDRYRHMTRITLSVGLYSGVVKDSLDFCLQTVLQSEGMNHTRVHIREEEARARCRCGHTYRLDHMLTACPNCGGIQRQLLSGQDVQIESVQMTDREE